MIKSRQTRVRGKLQAGESLLVSTPTNIRYLSGFTGSNGMLLVTTDVTYLFTDSRYTIQAHAECSDVEIVITRDLLGEAAKRCSTELLAIEGGNLTVLQYQTLQSVEPKLSIRVAKGLVEAVRVVKDDEEIALISQACAISTQALHQLCAVIRAGDTERQLARKLEDLMRELGADDIAFPTILATGPHTAIPHHEPTHRVLGQGELIKIDFGAMVKGYRSDCTRMLVCGTASQWQIDLFNAVKYSQDAGRSAVKAGATLASVNSAARTALAERDLGDLFTHGLGHGVGLDIHEDPFLRDDQTIQLETNTVVTVEPGAYIENVGGVRIEDTVLVTDSGYRNLTVFPYDLVSVG